VLALGPLSELVEPIIGNMRILKVICVLFCLFSLISAITGIQSVNASVSVGESAHTSSAKMVVAQNNSFIAYSFLAALLYAAAFYGIQKRKPLTWKLGWVVIIASFLRFITSVLLHSLKLPQPDCWIVSTAGVLIGSAVAIFWGVWWKRQKSYFSVQ
jgi:hypothetical protein